MKSGSRANGGFTLIEILLAIGILAVGITAVLFLFSMGARSHRRAIDRTRAALLAETVVNQIQADFRPGFPTDKIQNASHVDFPGFLYNITFTQLPESNHYYKVQVEVRWGDKNAPVDDRTSETYETILHQKSF